MGGDTVGEENVVGSSFTCHESMAYGADWIEGDVSASCSSYDRQAFILDANKM